jgi:Histidine kinase
MPMMPTVRALLLGSAVSLAGSPAWAEQRLLSVDRFDMRLGTAHASVPVTLDQVPVTASALTLETAVEISPGLRRAGQPLGLYIAALASHEVWWDETLLGRGGVVGRSVAEEVPGPVEAHYQIPDRLAGVGVHALRIHASSFHRHFLPRVGYWAVIVGDYEAILNWRKAAAFSSMIALSGLALTAGFALAMFGAVRERAALLLGLLAVSAAALLVVEVWRPLFGYSYDHHILRLWAVLILSWLTGMQLVALVVVRFRQRGGRWLIVGLALATLGIPWLVPVWDGKVLIMHALCFGGALAWTLTAAIRRISGAWPALLGLATACAVLSFDPSGFLDRLFLAFNFLFLCLLWSHAYEVRRLRQGKAAAELAATRLQLEMVRRQIQPHFLMNTLTALAEWVETDPPMAMRMIESIAEEFRLLGELSDQKIVRADEELRLCRSHLATMGLRKDVRYELEVEGVRGDEPIPPAVLHTLVENAVRHGAAMPLVTLRLRCTVEGGRRHLILESPAAANAKVAGPGTGTRYVEARLRQGWGDDWSFRQGRVGDTWRAEINMPWGSPA